MLEEIDEAFVAVDWEYRCVHANGTALQLAGKPLDELLGRRPWELFPGLVGTALERAYRDAMELGRSARSSIAPRRRRLARGSGLPHRGRGELLLPAHRRAQAHRGDLDRLLEAYELELSRSSLLRDVARAATSSLGLEEICQRVLEQIHLHADLRAAAIYAADWAADTIRALALFGPSDVAAPALRELPISDETDCGRLLLHDLAELTDERCDCAPLTAARR